jgi:hypothetical protein
MKHLLLLVSLFFFITVSQAQDATSVKGIVISSSTNEVLDRVNIVNLNQVIGTSTDDDGKFEIRAKTNDTLHF